MRSAERVPLYWQRPPEWDNFLESVEEQHSATALYAGFEIERAWEEYTNDHPAEEHADRLLQALGRRERDTREKTSRDRRTAGGEERATIRIRREVKEEMKSYSAEKKVPKHRVLRAVVCWYLDGGLLGHIERKLDEAVSEAEDQLVELDPSDERQLTAEDKKSRWLAKNVLEEDGGQFTRDDFGEALEAMPFRGGDTEHMRTKWLPKVQDRLEYAEHPKNPDLFVPEETAEEIAEETDVDRGAPAIDRKPYTDLTDDERVRGLRVELARRAGDRANGRYALPVSKVRDDVFDGAPGKRKTKGLMDRAADEGGYDSDAKGGEKRLKCTIGDVPHGVLADAGIVGDSNQSERDPISDVEEEMNALLDATPAADGGPLS